MLKNRVVGVLAAILAFAVTIEGASYGPQATIEDAGSQKTLEPLSVHKTTSLTILNQLRQHHYLSRELDNSTSSKIFDQYLDTLDPGRAYFLAADLQSLDKQYRFKLDEALKQGNLQPAFKIFNLFQKRAIDRINYLVEILNEGLEKLDFTRDEELEIDRKQAPWAVNRTEIDDLWRRRLKSSVLSMMLAGKDLAETQETLGKRYKNRLKQMNQTTSEDAFQLYINSFTSTYDPNTQYFSPRNSENFNITMSLSLQGIGAVLRSEDDYTSVVRLVPSGPADKSGVIKPSDRIIRVGQGETGELIDVVGWRLDDVVELIRGPKGSVVKLELIPAGSEDGTAKTVQITRNTVMLEDQSAQKKLLTYEVGGQLKKIGVIEIPTFYADFKAIQQNDPNYKSTTRDVTRLLGELKDENVEGIVIDLRNNGGGSLQEANSLTGLFIKSGPTVQVKSQRRNAYQYSDMDDTAAWDGPLAVIVNRLSASASEIFASAIQDYGRGIITGSQSFGKGTVQTLVPLKRGQLKITQAKYYRVSGQSTQHQGVVPDIEFPEVFNIDRIVESSLDISLQRDNIKPAVYPSGDGISRSLERLIEKHEQRVATDADFKYLRTLAERNREKRGKTHVSLNQAIREKEKSDDDTWRLEMENALLRAKGGEPLESLDDLDSAISDEEDPNDDAILRETGWILLNYIGFEQQLVMLEDAS